MKKSINKSILRQHKDVSDISIDTRVDDVFFNFAYVPVYVNTYTYRGKIYKTYISGTTGKVIGKTPKSVGKRIGNVLKGVALLALIGALGYFFFLR